MTIATVSFLSRDMAEAVCPDTAIAMISVTDPDAPPANLGDGFGALLRLSFHDLTAPVVGNDLHLFDSAMAHMVADFVDVLHTSSSLYSLAVHCEAGISRSAAIALFVAQRTGAFFPCRNRADLANRLVLGKLCETRPGIVIDVPPLRGLRHILFIEDRFRE